MNKIYKNDSIFIVISAIVLVTGLLLGIATIVAVKAEDSKPLTVTFDLNGGKESIYYSESKQVEYGEAITLPNKDSGFTSKKNYHLYAWEDPDGYLHGGDYSSEPVVITDSIKYKAVWDSDLGLNTTPTITKVTCNSGEYGIGDSFSVFVTVESINKIISSSYVTLERIANDSSEYPKIVKAHLSTTTPTYPGFYEAQFTVDKSWTSGTYFVKDIRLFTNDDPSAAKYVVKQPKGVIPETSIVINGGNEDSVKPIVSNIGFEQAVDNINRTFSVYLNADDSSGISDKSYVKVYQDSGAINAEEVTRTANFVKQDDSGRYVATFAPSSKNWGYGNYKIIEAKIFDNSGNSTILNKNSVYIDEGYIKLADVISYVDPETEDQTTSGQESTTTSPEDTTSQKIEEPTSQKEPGPTYNVRFDLGLGSPDVNYIESMEVEQGSYITLPTERNYFAKRDGYRLTGWTISSQTGVFGGVYSGDSVQVNEDITFSAFWEKVNDSSDYCKVTNISAPISFLGYKVGDTIKVDLNVSSKYTIDTDRSYVILERETENNSEYYKTFREYLGKTSDNNYHASFVVDKNWTKGTYHVKEVKLVSTSGYRNLYAKNRDKEIPERDIIVVGDNTDAVLPVIHECHFSQDLDNNNKAFSVLVKATDENGIKYGSVSITRYTEDKDAVYYSKSSILKPTDIEGYYVANFSVDNTWPKGTYFIGNVHVGDNCGNATSISRSQSNIESDYKDYIVIDNPLKLVDKPITDISYDSEDYLSIVKINKDSIELATKKTEKLLLFNVPDDATVSWVSSNPDVATVDNDGLVTAKSYGTAVVKATVTKGDKTIKLLCNVQTRFYDVADKTMSGYTQIYWAADNGITKGYNGGEYFGPTQKCTRQEFAIFLWRAFGQPAPESTTLPFKDTKDLTGSSLNAIAWATEKGIIKGFDDGTFRPKANVTREQIVIMLWRAAGEPKATKEPGFTDTGSLDKGRSSYKAIAWASEKGIVQGFTDNTFRPKDNSKRNQVVIMLYRYAHQK